MELRGIDPPTSAMRLHKELPQTAVFRVFLLQIVRIFEQNGRIACDMLAIHTRSGTCGDRPEAPDYRSASASALRSLNGRACLLGQPTKNGNASPGLLGLKSSPSAKASESVVGGDPDSRLSAKLFPLNFSALRAGRYASQQPPLLPNNTNSG